MRGALPPKAPELVRLLEPLVRHGVDFVLIGGMAGIAHGSTYPSYDLDVLGDVEGIGSYDELAAAATGVEVGGVAVRVASIAHLIAMKRAANRPKDRLMLEEYVVLADEQAKAEREKADQ